MKINHVHAVYFSPTGNAKKVVTTLAQAIADTLGVQLLLQTRGSLLPVTMRACWGRIRPTMRLFRQ